MDVLCIGQHIQMSRHAQWVKAHSAFGLSRVCVCIRPPCRIEEHSTSHCVRPQSYVGQNAL